MVGWLQEFGKLNKGTQMIAIINRLQYGHILHTVHSIINLSNKVKL